MVFHVCKYTGLVPWIWVISQISKPWLTLYRRTPRTSAKVPNVCSVPGSRFYRTLYRTEIMVKRKDIWKKRKGSPCFLFGLRGWRVGSGLDLQFETLCDLKRRCLFGQNFQRWTQEMDPMDPKEKALRIFRDMQKKHKQCNTILYTTLKLVSLKKLENAWKNYHLESQVSYFFRQLYP